MEIQEILKTKGDKVWSVKASQMVREALDVLVNNKIGALLVFDDKDSIAGVLSERDIMRECYRNSDGFSKTLVKDVMTKRVIVGKPEDKVDYIMGIMTKNRIRHVPIIKDGKLQGVVSIGDVVKAKLQDSSYENQYLKEYMFGSEPPQDETGKS